MHELSLMQSALDIAIERAQQEGATKIVSITMRIGALSGVVPEALEFAFQVLREETIAADATLTIDAVPVTAFCKTCSDFFETQDPIPVCPRCSRLASDVRSGREMEIASMEVS